MRPKKYHKLDAEKFIRIWQSSKSRAEAQKRYKHLGIQQLSIAATNLRRRGVNLKKFAGARNAERHDYEALKALADKCRK